MLSVSRLDGITTIKIGNPSDKVTKVICEGGVTLQIFDLSTTPLYTIIPSINVLTKDYIFKVLDSIQKKSMEVPGKNTKMVELYSLFNGVCMMFDEEELTKFEEFEELHPEARFCNYKNRDAILKFAKKQIHFIPNLMHSMQNSDYDLVFELCKVEGLTFAELKNKMSMKDGISEVLPLIAQFLKVRKGFTGDTRETPIPSFSKGIDGGVDLRTCYVSPKCKPKNIVDLLGLTMFRHIGLQLLREEIIILFTELLYSKIPLNEGVKEVLKDLLSLDFVAFDQVMLYNEPTSVSMWQTSKLVPNISEIKLVESEIAAFIFYFQTWYLDYNKSNMSFEKMAELFGFDLKFLHTKSLKVLNKSFKTDKKGFTFKKWLSLVNWTWRKKMGPRGGIVIVKREKKELLNVFKGLYNATFEPMVEKYTQKFESLVDFMKSKGIEFKECLCCNNLYMGSLVKDFTMSCNVCNTSDVCMTCTEKLYNEDPVEGRVLNMSSVSCICCRTIFPDMTERFPEGTLEEDIKAHSNEFYSCCVHGCKNFVHVQQEGVGCADRPDTVMDIFCANHAYMNGSVMREMCKECPGCHTMVLKNDGCNHMTCTCGTEFCMCKECPYVKPMGEVYSHPFYCRHGISNSETRFVLRSIMRDIRCERHFGVIPRELVESILIRMQHIMYQGIETPLRTILWQLTDYMNSSFSDVSILFRIISDIEQRVDVEFPEHGV
jgi:hypothetical protein